MHYQGVPIMASNMDGVGTFQMADTLINKTIYMSGQDIFSRTELIQYFTTGNGLAKRCFVAMSIGIAEHDLEKLDQVMTLNVIKFFMY